MKKLLSIIIPVYNEATNIEWHNGILLTYFRAAKLNYELIYVDDGSTDQSLNIIKRLSSGNKQIRYISFSRNFGKEAATTAGLRACTGDAAVMIDADGQHPVELIDNFINAWDKGSQVVIGVRSANTKEGWIKKYGSVWFYKVLNAFTEGNTRPGSTDYRLLDRKVINEFVELSEHNRITRGLIDWLGFKRTYVEFVAPERHDGNASYSIKKLFRLAFHAFVSQTTKPLQFTGFLGFFVMSASALVGIALTIEKYPLGDPLNLAITGSALIAIFVSFLVGLVLISNWLLALYIESIHSETQNRPLYIIDELSEK